MLTNSSIPHLLFFYLADEVSHKFVVLSQLALEEWSLNICTMIIYSTNLLFARFSHQGVWGGLVALIKTNADLISGSHLTLKNHRLFEYFASTSTWPQRIKNQTSRNNFFTAFITILNPPFTT